MTRVLYVDSRHNTFTRIDRELLESRFEVDEYFQAGAVPRIRELVSKLRRCDVVFGWHASWHTLAALWVARILGKPSVLVIGGFDTASVPEIGYGNQQDPLRKWRSRLTTRAATRLMTNSNYSRSEIEQNMGIPGSRVRVVHHGLEDRFGATDPAAKRRVALTVGVVHRWNLERKGHRAFVEAASRLEDVEFVLAGRWEDDAVDLLRELAGANVTLTGYLTDDELDHRFREATVYVQASWHEGFGLALAEGMLAGAVPVVTTRGALPEVVGETGISLAGLTPDDIAAGVSRGLDLGPAEGARARARVLEEFPVESRAAGIIAEVEAAAQGLSS